MTIEPTHGQRQTDASMHRRMAGELQAKLANLVESGLMTPTDIAAAADTTPGRVSKWINEGECPSSGHLIALARRCGQPFVRELLQGLLAGEDRTQRELRLLSSLHGDEAGRPDIGRAGGEATRALLAFLELWMQTQRHVDRLRHPGAASSDDRHLVASTLPLAEQHLHEAGELVAALRLAIAGVRTELTRRPARPLRLTDGDDH